MRVADVQLPPREEERLRPVWDPHTGYPIEAVARRKGVTPASIRRWVRNGAFPPPEKNGGKRGRCIWSGSVLNSLEPA